MIFMGPYVFLDNLHGHAARDIRGIIPSSKTNISQMRCRRDVPRSFGHGTSTQRMRAIGIGGFRFGRYQAL